MLIFSVFLFFTIGSELFRQFDFYTIRFSDVSVSGLDEGGSVKYQGIKVGSVYNIYIDPEDINTVVVKVRLQRGTPIREDTEAIIGSTGITGIKYIGIRSGSPDSPPIEPGGEIKAGLSLLENISGQAELMMEKLMRIMNNIEGLTDENNRKSIPALLGSVEHLSTNIEAVLDSNKGKFSTSMENAAEISKNLAETSSSLNRISTKLDELINGGNIEKTINNVESLTGKLDSQFAAIHLDSTFSNINKVLNTANMTLTHYDLVLLRSRDNIIRALQDIEESAGNLRQATALIRDDPSLLLRRRGESENY